MTTPTMFVAGEVHGHLSFATYLGLRPVLPLVLLHLPEPVRPHAMPPAGACEPRVSTVACLLVLPYALACGSVVASYPVPMQLPFLLR